MCSPAPSTGPCVHLLRWSGVERVPLTAPPDGVLRARNQTNSVETPQQSTSAEPDGRSRSIPPRWAEPSRAGAFTAEQMSPGHARCATKRARDATCCCLREWRWWRWRAEETTDEDSTTDLNGPRRSRILRRFDPGPTRSARRRPRGMGRGGYSGFSLAELKEAGDL